LELHPDATISYGSGFQRSQFPDHGSKIVTASTTRRSVLRVAKIHGSINWLYCDNCRRVFWFPPDQAVNIADQLVGTHEWKLIAPRVRFPNKDQWECARCNGVKLSTRIATFSYRKALEFPMFQKSWLDAERFLRTARRWIFIGYSLPAADFEFKYLMKRVELSRSDPPDVVLVTGGDGARLTGMNFRRFFGSRLNSKEFQDGLTPEAVEFITAR